MDSYRFLASGAHFRPTPFGFERRTGSGYFGDGGLSVMTVGRTVDAVAVTVDVVAVGLGHDFSRSHVRLGLVVDVIFRSLEIKANKKYVAQ